MMKTIRRVEETEVKERFNKLKRERAVELKQNENEGIVSRESVTRELNLILLISYTLY